jgi:hypothetical protein
MSAPRGIFSCPSLNVVPFSPQGMPFTGPQYTMGHAFAPGAPMPHVQFNYSPLAPAPDITSPTSALPGNSRLSSPFTAATSLAPPHAANSAPPALAAGSRATTGTSHPHPHKTVTRPTEGSAPPAFDLPQTPVQRPVRLDHSAPTANPWVEEVENRRPEYLVRAARPDSPSLDRYGEDGPVVAGLGIAVSPMKGRRIKLFQETSEESFEQSLMAGGYGKFGTHPERPSPSMHQRTLEWLEQAKAGPAAPAAPLPAEREPDAKELLKRKRLAAFQPEGAHPPASRLRPVDVLGMGRMLLEVPEVEQAVATEEVAKKKGKARKKKPAPAVPAMLPNLPEDSETKGPSWVDAAFPWSLRASERADRMEKEKRERLRWIEKYFERDSDDESQSDEEDDLTPVVEDADPMDVDQHSFRGHGPHPHDAAAAPADGLRQGRFVVPGQAADARWQLTKRTVPRRGAANDPGLILGLLCVCKTPDDGRHELVKCDDCQTWYHPPCLGIADVADLGGEDELWFCPRCTGAPLSSPRTPLATSFAEPAFYTAHQTPFSASHADPVLSYAPGLQESPIPSWPASLSAPSAAPATPVYTGTRSGGASVFSSRSTATTLSDSSSRGAPTTPRSSKQGRDVRILTSPDGYDSLGFHGSYDPLATPSRSARYTEPFSTPKTGDWSARGLGVPWSTGPYGSPGKAPHRPTTPTRQSAALPVTPSRAVEDSPVVRSAKKARVGA